MRSFEYGDDYINGREMTLSIISMIIGIRILTLPKYLASGTHFSDGWISLVIAGGSAILLGLLICMLAMKLQRQTYYEFTASLLSRPVAAVLTLAISLYFLLFSAYEVRMIASISKQYLFDRTPIEVIALLFLLLVVYAACGSRVGIIRLNVMFIPLVIGIAAFVLLFSIGIFEREELQPVFTSSPIELLTGARHGLFSLLGFEIVLFYAAMMNKPKDIYRSMAVGVAVPTVIYIAIYLICIGVFSREGVMEVMYPAVELAKESQIPGEFFERFEFLFFVIWIMAIFNTTAMSVDIVVVTLQSLSQRIKRVISVCLLSPLIYLIAMLPKNHIEMEVMDVSISYLGIGAAIAAPILVLAAAALKGASPGAR